MLLAPIFWSVGSYPPIDPLSLTSGFLSLIFATLCFVIAVLDTIEVFRMWMGKKGAHTQIQDEHHQSLLSQHDDHHDH